MGTCPTENAAMCSLFAARSLIMIVGGALAGDRRGTLFTPEWCP